MRSLARPLAFGLVVLGAAGAPGAQTRPPLPPELRAFVKVEASTIVLRHVRVIDGTGAPARENQSLVIAGGKIATIGGDAGVAVPEGATVLDLAGCSVLPGIVGMHEHMYYPTPSAPPAMYGEHATSFPRLYLAGGVTTMRTTGSVEPYTDLEIKRAIDDGTILGPKMRITGPYLEGEGAYTPQMRQLRDAEDARRTVLYWMDEGATSFKAYMHVTPAELEAIVKTAHARSIKVTGHLCAIGFREAAAIGIDDLEHGLAVDTEFFSGKMPGVCPDAKAAAREMAETLDVAGAPVQEMIRDLVARKVAVTSTLPVFETFVPGRAPLAARVLDAMTSDARISYLKVRASISDGAATSPWPALFKKELQFEHDFAKAGGLLLAGLDPTGYGGVIPGFGDQREIELLVEAGFTPVEAIRIATSNGARFLGELDRIGILAPGKDADIVVVRGDPSTTIADIEKVEIVFKDGVGYDSAKLIDSVRGLVGLR
jgi:imidazolonepropionase-like amidohydrolase